MTSNESAISLIKCFKNTLLSAHLFYRVFPLQTKFGSVWVYINVRIRLSWIHVQVFADVNQSFCFDMEIIFDFANFMLSQSPGKKMLALNVSFTFARVRGLYPYWHFYNICHIMLTLHVYFLSGPISSLRRWRMHRWEDRSEHCLRMCFEVWNHTAAGAIRDNAHDFQTQLSILLHGE